jgi:hypothetical protein
MGNSVLSAMNNIVRFHNNDLSKYASSYLIRINAIGEQLEFYVKDALADSFTKSQLQKDAEYSNVFSWLGNQNNPPDVILKGGDAFEIKKIESPKSSLALNSSPPKDQFNRSDPQIVKACRECENSHWDHKDFFYVIGYAQKGVLKNLFFIHGKCYAANKNIYEKPVNAVKSALTSGDLELSETRELGRVNKVDPLGITNLRVRGMWEIKNPIVVFQDIYSYDKTKNFSLIAVMTKGKYYNSMPQEDIDAVENNALINIKDVNVKDPNNPAKRLDAKMITSSW